MGKGCVALKSEKQQSRHCAQIGKSSAVTFNLLKDVQIVNGCYTAEMLLTDAAIVVNSNCLLRTRFGELHPYVPKWRKIVSTVIALISRFLSQKSLPAVFLVPTALPASLALSLSLSYCVLSAVSPSRWAFLLLRLFNLSFYPPSPALGSITHLLHCFSLFWNDCFDLPFYTPSQQKQEADQTSYLFVICVRTYREFMANKDDNSNSLLLENC